MITINPAEEMAKTKEELADCKESISVLSNAIACGFLYDKHSLIIQEWLKEYKFRAEYLNEIMEGQINEQWKRKNSYSNGCD